MRTTEADLNALAAEVADMLIGRVLNAIPQDAPELLDLWEQWVTARTLALKYHKDERATIAANAHFDELITALREHGITAL